MTILNDADWRSFRLVKDLFRAFTTHRNELKGQKEKKSFTKIDVNVERAIEQ